MKKILGTVFILLSTLLIGYSQQDNNTNDDVYYQDDQQPTQQPDQNYTDDDNNQDASAPTYQTFYDQLSPYGSWVNYPGYGYCWVPSNMDPNFSPYMTNGNWVYTDMGWTWVSDYAWGWGPFHYGRWFDDPSYGWMWVPGYDWAPAWVVWGDYGGYYGWACLGPHDVLSPHFRPDRDHWHFVDHQYLGRRDFGDHVRRSEDIAHGQDINSHVNIIGHANTYGQSVFFSGPKASEVEKYTGQKVERVQINNVKGPAPTKVTGGQVNIYRPSILRSNNQPVPNKINNAQPARNDNNQRGNNPVQNNPPQRKNNNQPRSNPQTDWQQRSMPTPPRQNSPQPARQTYTPPSQPARQTYSPPVQQPQHTFVPSSRPTYSAPSYSAPRGGSFGGGGGASHGGGGRR